MQLHQQHQDKILCISYNLDYNGSADQPPESLREPVLKILEVRDATCTNIISSDPDEKVYETLDLAAVPAVLVYDKTGKLRKQFDNDEGEFGDAGFKYEQHVVPLVESLLAE